MMEELRRGQKRMTEQKKLWNEYQAKLEQLQESCPHTELSDWMEEWWAVGHSTGYFVKICERCGIIIETTRGKKE